MLVSEFDYELPEELIARSLVKKEIILKCWVLDKTERSIQHKHFYDIVDFLDDNLSFNFDNTKVIPARLSVRKKVPELK